MRHLKGNKHTYTHKTSKKVTFRATDLDTNSPPCNLGYRQPRQENILNIFFTKITCYFWFEDSVCVCVCVYVSERELWGDFRSKTDFFQMKMS